jgi:tryptophan synthase beta chain
MPLLPSKFGPYGGQFVPDTLMRNLEELEAGYAAARSDPAFWAEVERYGRDYAGRPSLLYFANRFTERIGGPRFYLKREDLNHTGSHKINHCLGQILLARRLGKKRIVAETGAGQHGVATATVCALFGLECVVYMGEEDTRRQALNVFRMKLLGADVVPVTSGSRTLKDAINEAIRDWISNVDTTYYLLGSVIGPHPYPTIVRDLQAVVGREARTQILQAEGKLPAAVIACVGGGSNAMGIFQGFVGDAGVKLIGVEAAGRGLGSNDHSASLAAGRPGVLHGCFTYLLQDKEGQVSATHSVAPGLDYPAVGPEHAWFKDSRQAHYAAVTDGETLAAFRELCRLEGIIPALEPSHALAYAIRTAAEYSKEDAVIVNLSGRGDKDVQLVHDLESKPKSKAKAKGGKRR